MTTTTTGRPESAVTTAAGEQDNKSTQFSVLGLTSTARLAGQAKNGPPDTSGPTAAAPAPPMTGGTAAGRATSTRAAATVSTASTASGEWRARELRRTTHPPTGEPSASRM